MASLFSLRTSTFHNQEIVRSWNLAKSGSKKLCASNIYVKEQSFGCIKYIILQGCLSASLSQKISVKCIPSEALGSVEDTGNLDQNIIKIDPSIASRHWDELEFSRVNCLVWVLHESARSFSVAVQTLELAKNGPELASAWVGVDVHAWHKSIAYQVAIYALLKAAIEVEVFLSRKRINNVSSVHEILSPITDFLGERIESRLNLRNPKLVQWFRTLELPRIAGLFIPLFKKWSVDYAGRYVLKVHCLSGYVCYPHDSTKCSLTVICGLVLRILHVSVDKISNTELFSGVAGNILAISCCTAVRKLGSGRVSCPLFSASVEDALVELMNFSHRLVSVDKLHYLATEAGFEEDFLFHFGRKVLPSNSIEDVEFWIGLVQTKLSNAFHRENVIADKHTFHDKVVVNEIGWLDFYAAAASKFCVKRRSKQQPIQAEKEIILYTVLTVCYDIIAGFAQYSNSAQQPLDAKLLDFLLQREVQKFAERSASDPAASLIIKGGIGSSIILEAKEKPTDLIKKEKHHFASRLYQATSSAVMDPVTLVELDCSTAPKPLHENLLRKSTSKLISASVPPPPPPSPLPTLEKGAHVAPTDIAGATPEYITVGEGRETVGSGIWSSSPAGTIGDPAANPPDHITGEIHHHEKTTTKPPPPLHLPFPRSLLDHQSPLF
ncbi:hypothetical protein RND71_006090 [Anisodus tanguticus]|uniref:Uncharacterized protein n=1 Tax=Anisodus tanguticus TaxID=243964 RepID=A0AAE1VM51_9SOLA|nr:hypothetical protein RND71_006090 [Anisodus tanguticus]